MSTSAEDLRAIALTEFATAGYVGTSLHRIADIAGLSKSSVLYHFASKEVLLGAAVGPAVDAMDDILSAVETGPLTGARRREFIVHFVDFLLEHRLEVHMFINQGPSLVDVPVFERANELVRRLARYFSTTTTSTEDRMRFGVALGGAAYMLVASQTFEIEPSPVDETRAALINIVTELLAPVDVSPQPVPATR
ncbi:TetR/AcrR family transcriptional regulator [Parafrigoribacterium mesophilum]|uniref:TetR/AcrR family transcriptional regulator n=1 Tax=Parafrigoribacterium mesophilum TaxID=433646 RepID=UPI0031FE2F31